MTFNEEIILTKIQDNFHRANWAVLKAAPGNLICVGPTAKSFWRNTLGFCCYFVVFIMVRIKNRYVVVQIVPLNVQTKVLHIKDHLLTKCILSYVQKFYGVYGAGLLEHGFRVKYCNERTKIAIMRCSHHSYKFVTSILPLITVISDTRAKFRTIYTGATIMQCNKFIIKHQQQFLDRMVGEIESAKERQDMIKRVLEFEIN